MQMIIAIDREFGSGGKEIAHLLGEIYQIPVYEKNILDVMNLDRKDQQTLKHRDESVTRIGKTTVHALTNTSEDVVAAMEFEFLKEEAARGKSFVILGHCANEVLREYEALTTVFISAGKEFKLPRIMEEHHLSLEEAKKMMKRHNRKRRNYQHTYSSLTWGKSADYDLCIRSDILGTQKSARIIQTFVEARFS